jgi:glycosyltransferase involved in cell wall biosynthesis
MRSAVNELPIVSIVTPAYNQGHFLAETIKSVLSQSYPRVEYLVLDDGSTDDTPQVAASFGEQIRYERHQNMGQALTLNRGWEMSTGEYLGYLSSDDLLCDGAIDELAAVLREDSDCVCVFPDCDLIDEQSRVVKQSVSRPFDLAQLVVDQECYIGPGALFRRGAFERIGGWRSDLRLAPDREFWMRLAGQGTIRMLPRSLARYRIHAGAISYKDTAPEVAREYLRVLDRYFELTDVPPSIRSRKDEAYGRAHLIVARNCFRAAKWKQGMSELRRACELHPPLAGLQTGLKLARNVVSKPVRIAMAKVRRLL